MMQAGQMPGPPGVWPPRGGVSCITLFLVCLLVGRLPPQVKQLHAVLERLTREKGQLIVQVGCAFLTEQVVGNDVDLQAWAQRTLPTFEADPT